MNVKELSAKERKNDYYITLMRCSLCQIRRYNVGLIRLIMEKKR